MSNVDFGAINAVANLLKVRPKSKRDLIDLLGNRYSGIEIDKALHDAISLKFIKQVGLIKERHHDNARYRLISNAV